MNYLMSVYYVNTMLFHTMLIDEINELNLCRRTEKIRENITIRTV